MAHLKHPYTFNKALLDHISSNYLHSGFWPILGYQQTPHFLTEENVLSSLLGKLGYLLFTIHRGSK